MSSLHIKELFLKNSGSRSLCVFSSVCLFVYVFFLVFLLVCWPMRLIAYLIRCWFVFLYLFYGQFVGWRHLITLIPFISLLMSTSSSRWVSQTWWTVAWSRAGSPFTRSSSGYGRSLTLCNTPELMIQGPPSPSPRQGTVREIYIQLYLSAESG